ncbi:hypothetical protein U1Q18_032146 [Sarracenia purpurea var. burkii]
MICDVMGCHLIPAAMVFVLMPSDWECCCYGLYDAMGRGASCGDKELVVKRWLEQELVFWVVQSWCFGLCCLCRVGAEFVNILLSKALLFVQSWCRFCEYFVVKSFGYLVAVMSYGYRNLCNLVGAVFLLAKLYRDISVEEQAVESRCKMSRASNPNLRPYGI